MFDTLIAIARSCDVKFNYNDGDDQRLCVDLFDFC